MNGIDHNEKNNRRMTPERILEMFEEVVKQQPSKSYDFPISDLLEQYRRSRILPNFPEAAIIIERAGTVYSRKIDYLEALLMAMHDKQNAPDRNDKPDNPEQADKATEKKRLPGKRLKNVDHTITTIQLTCPKQIKKSAATVEKMNLNSSDTSDSDKFKNYCQAVNSKVPVFYERVNLLISDKTDSYFDGARAISKDDPDCQKNYNVFVGCISFKEKQMMSQREFLNRIQFDNLDGGFDQTNSNVPAAPDHAHNSTAINENGQSSMVAGDFTSNNETDLLESLREISLLMDRLGHDATGDINDFDSAMVDDDNASQLMSTVDGSTINGTTEQNTLTEPSIALDGTLNASDVINSTGISNINETMGESTGISNVNNETGSCDAQTTVNSTLNASETLNSTQDMSTINGTQDASTLNGTQDASTLNGTQDASTLNGTQDASTLNGTQDASTLNVTQDASTAETNGTLNGDTQMNSTCANDTLTNGSQLDPNATTGCNETLEATVPNNDSDLENAECVVDSRNIFRINEEYLKLNEVFRLPLSVLQQEVNITLNVFGIPFGRLRRQVKFALPKDFDSLRPSKRKRDFDECSTTTIRKFVKLNDGSATPSIELTASSGQPTSTCDPLTDSSIVPASDTNTAATPLEAPSQSVDGTSVENGVAADCSAGENAPNGDGLSTIENVPNGDGLSTIENAPNGDQLSTIENALETPSQLVDGVTETQDSAIDDFGISDCVTNDDGPSLSKLPGTDIQCDAQSAFDSGIGTGTEGSLIEGTIATRRMTLDLTPPSEEIENELSAEADEQSASRIQEMTNLSEKVHSWHQRLKPILLHSEKRNDFDVKETSRNIVSCLENSDSPSNRIVSFESVMEHRDKADTARYFFSMLQMANNRNIEIIVNHKDSSKLCPQNKIMLKLLNPNIREIDPNIEKN